MVCLFLAWDSFDCGTLDLATEQKGTPLSQKTNFPARGVLGLSWKIMATSALDSAVVGQ